MGLEQPIVAVAVAEDLACVDMVDGRLIENLHVDDARRVLAWADAIAERATHRLTLRRQAHGETDRESRGRYWRSRGHRRGHSALALSFGRQKRTCGCRSKIWRRRGRLPSSGRLPPSLMSQPSSGWAGGQRAYDIKILRGPSLPTSRSRPAQRPAESTERRGAGLDQACVDLRLSARAATCSRVRVCRESTSTSRAIRG